MAQSSMPSTGTSAGPNTTLRIRPLAHASGSASASQVDFGAGPIDLLVTDPQGRVAIVEFKRGSENPDVRRVVAQLLDYGSSVWRRPGFGPPAVE